MSLAGAAEPKALRLFVALWPSAQDQHGLWRASGAAIAGSGGRAIPARNLHVTLAFLGNGEPAQLPQLRAALRRGVAASTSRPRALQLQFKALEHWARPQILCASADAQTPDATAVFALAAGIRQALLAAGFTPDLKPFRAHVTVARKVARAPERQPADPVMWNCADLALVASTTAAAGSVYSVLESWPLDRVENARE